MVVNGKYTHGGDIYSRDIKLDFSANVNPFGTPEKVRAAITEAACDLSVYPDPYCGPLREKLAGKLAIGAQDIICGNGAAELIYQFAAALKPRKTLLPVPSFSDYEEALRAAGCTPEFYYLKRENGFEVTTDLLDKIAPDTDLVILCSLFVLVRHTSGRQRKQQSNTAENGEGFDHQVLHCLWLLFLTSTTEAVIPPPDNISNFG